MASKDFDIEALADYLHLTPQQVERLANRGKVPGRKVAGQWRFSPAEIHHWMEERIGLSEEEELVQVEQALHRSSGAEGPIPNSIASLLGVEAIALPLEARTRGSVISEIARLAAGTGLLWDPQKMEEAVRAREQLASTALDSGVALLHPRRPLSAILAQPLLALGVTSRGIPFGEGGQLTDIFFLICSTDDRGHLQVLARLSRLISDPAVLVDIRAATDPAALHDLLAERERALIVGPEPGP